MDNEKPVTLLMTCVNFSDGEFDDCTASDEVFNSTWEACSALYEDINGWLDEYIGSLKENEYSLYTSFKVDYHYFDSCRTSVYMEETICGTYAGKLDEISLHFPSDARHCMNSANILIQELNKPVKKISLTIQEHPEYHNRKEY